MFDVNYRAKLWKPEAARTTLAPFIASADVLVCGIADARTLYGHRDETPEAIARSLAERRGGRTVVLTLGSEGAGLLEQGSWSKVASRPVHPIDDLGAGDALDAGLIDGMLAGDLFGGLERGVAWAARSLETKGDVLILSPDERRRDDGGAEPRVRR